MKQQESKPQSHHPLLSSGFSALRPYALRKLFIKNISWSLILSLAYSQMLYAADPRQILASAKLGFQEDNPERGSVGMGSSELAASQSSAENRVAQANNLNDLIDQNPTFSLTTQNGDILNYVNGKLLSVKQKDGNTLNGISLDSSGLITSANLTLSDGSVQIFENGQVISYAMPDGSTIFYRAGQIDHTFSKDGLRSDYGYDETGKTLLWIKSNKLQTFYNPDGSLKETVSEGKRTLYQNGLLDRILNPDGTSFIYKTSDDQTKVMLYSFIDSKGLEFVLSVDKMTLTQGDHSYEYDLNGTLRRITYQDHYCDLYTSGEFKGLIQHIFYSPTSENRYVYSKNPDGTIRYDLYAKVQKTKKFGLSNRDYWTWAKVGGGQGIALGTPPTPIAPSSLSLPELRYILYSDSKTPLEVVKSDGTKVTFKDGLPDQVTDKEGNLVSEFTFDQNEYLNLTGTQITQNNLNVSYDAKGNLAQVKVGDLTIHYKDKDIDFITNDNGTATEDDDVDLKNIKFSGETNVITDVTILSSDGEERTYKDGHLIKLRRADETILDYHFDEILKELQINKLTTPETLVYNFNYTAPDTITAELDLAASKILPNQDLIKMMEYSADYSLKKIIRQNNESISYLKDKTQLVETDKENPKIVTYDVDGSYTVDEKDANDLNSDKAKATTLSRAFYDKNRQILKTIMYPTADNPNTLEIHYLYGKIYEIYKNTLSKPTFKYSYTFTPEGEELTQIDDLEENTKKTYKDGVLLKSIAADTSVVSTYNYYDALPMFIQPLQPTRNLSAKKIKEVVVTRLGKPLHTYSYKYKNTNAIVTDEEGVVRTYNEKNKLTYLEKDKKKFAYTYTPKTSYEYAIKDGPKQLIEEDENVREELIEQILSDGSLVHYQDGKAIQIDHRPDGSVITNILLNDDRSFKQATLTLQSGIKKVFTPTEVTEEIYADNTHFYFKDKKLQKVERPDGDVLELTYDLKSDDTIQNIWATINGVALKYDPDGTLLGFLPEESKGFVQGQSLFKDQSTKGHPVSVIGDAKLSAYGSIPSGEAFGIFDGDRDYLSVPRSSDFDFGQGDFSIETWVYLNQDGSQCIVSKDQKPGGWLFLVSQDNLCLYSNWNSPKAVSTYLELHKWHKIKVERKGDALEYYVDDKVQGSPIDVKGVSFDGASTDLLIGAYDHGNSGHLNAYLDDLKIVKGSTEALSLDFEAKDRAFHELISPYTFRGEGGQLSYNSDGTFLSEALNSQGTQYFKDSSDGSHPVFFYGQTHVDAGKVTFDGDKDRLFIPSSEDFNFGTKDFSIDLDVNFSELKNTVFMDRGSAYDFEFISGSLVWNALGSQRKRESWNPRTNTFYHVTLKREAGLLKIFVDGQELGRSTPDSLNLNVSADMSLGSFTNKERSFNGQWDSFKITRDGKAVLDLKFDNEIQETIHKAREALTGRIAWLESFPSKELIEPQNPSYSEWLSIATESILTSDSIAIQEYSTTGIMETQTKADQTVTLFDNKQTEADGSVTTFEKSKPVKVVDQSGKILIGYSYDAHGNPSRVYLKNARDTLPDQFIKARQQVAERKAEQLDLLAQKKDKAYEDFKETVEGRRSGLLGQLSALEGQRGEVSGIKAKGKKAKSEKGDVLNQIDEAISQTRQALTKLAEQEAQAAIDLDNSVKDVSDQIDTAAKDAYTALSNQETALKKEILRQEVSPIVYDYYRRILGRDPASAEYDSWIGKVNYDSGAETQITTGQSLTKALSDYLDALPELEERRNYVTNIKQKVTNEISGYFLKSDNDKRAFIQNTLGLSDPEDGSIQLTQADADKILAWMNSNPTNLHFGQSAFLSLEALLEKNGITLSGELSKESGDVIDSQHLRHTREEMATLAILVDIFTGVISPLDDGDLVISVFSLNKVAALYGVNLKGAKLNWEDLQAVYKANPTARVIAHINGNHYVIVTAITNDSITYIDPGIGKDKQNESLTVKKEGFLKAWDGNVTADSVILSDAKQREGSHVKILTTQEAQKVRGAFWGSLLGLLSWVFVFIPPLSTVLRIASIAVSLIEGDWITAITSAVNLSFPGGGTVANSLKVGLSNAFQGVSDVLGSFGQALNTIGNGLASVYQSVTGFINSAINFLPGVSSVIQGTALKLLGASVGALVVNSAISTGITYGVSRGLNSLGVSPEITGIVSQLAAGAAIQALERSTLPQSDQATAQANNIQTGIAGFRDIDNVGRLGAELGIDPRLTEIAGLSLGAIRGQLINNPNLTSSTFFDAFKDIRGNLAGSLARYGIDKLGSSLGFPALGSILGAPVSNAFASQFNSQTKYAGEVKLEGQSEIAVDGTRYRDERTGQIILIPTQERSFWDNTISFFRDHLSDMINIGINAYYASQAKPIKINQPNTPPITEAPLPDGATPEVYQDIIDGKIKSGYRISSSATNYSVYDRQSRALVKRVSGNITEEGRFESMLVKKADGSIGYEYTDLSKENIYYEPSSGAKATFKISDGSVQEIYLEGSSPEIVLEPGYNIDATNKVINGTIRFPDLGVVVDILGGKVSKEGQSGSSVSSKDLIQPLVNYYLLPGIGNDVAENEPVKSVEEFKNRLVSDEKINPDLIHPISLFEADHDWLHFFRDIGEWNEDASGGNQGLSEEVTRKLRAEYSRMGPNQKVGQQIAVTYSGSTNPMIRALSRTAEFGIETLISWGGVVKNLPTAFPADSKFKTFINVWGSLDDAQTLTNVVGASVGSQNIAASGVKTFNIKILGAHHTDFWYSDDKWKGKNSPKNQEINRKTSIFLQKLTKAADSPSSLRIFLAKKGIEGSFDDDTLTVDLELFFKENGLN